jgi:hypothetical protein
MNINKFKTNFFAIGVYLSSDLCVCFSVFVRQLFFGSDYPFKTNSLPLNVNSETNFFAIITSDRICVFVFFVKSAFFFCPDLRTDGQTYDCMRWTETKLK